MADSTWCGEQCDGGTAEGRAAWVLRYLRLPDARLVARCQRVLAAWLRQPGATLAQAAADRAEAKAGYNLLANRDVVVSALVEAICRHGGEECGGESRVYIAQDTTSLEYGHREPIEGLGPVTSTGTQGLLVHTSLALSGQGLPLGLTAQRIWTRPPEKLSPKHLRPMSERESMKWLEGMRESADRLPAGCHPIFVMDREGDIHEVLAEARAAGWGVIVRSNYNRRVAGEAAWLRDTVRQQPVAVAYELTVPRKKGERPSRETRLEVRRCTVTLTPSCKGAPHRQPVEVGVVLVTEPDPPPDVEGLEWCLVTTEPVGTAAQAREIAERYTWRWRVEEFHLALKSGCKIESYQFDHGDRIGKAVALLSEVALMIVKTTYWARTAPEAPASELLDEYEIEALRRRMRGTRNPMPDGPLTIADAVRLIGRLGGHLGRKCDGPVGVRSLWKGWVLLQAMASILRPIHSDDTYG